jgi:hypothetical protein
MAISKTSLKFAKIVYWLLMSVGVIALTYMLFKAKHAIAGILWLVFGFMLVYIMYPFYFPPGTGAGQWPPYIAACPDYLTLQNNMTDCMDFVGLGATGLSKANRTQPPAPGSTDYNQYVFRNTGTTAEKVARAQQYGLSWQGLV